MLTAIRSMFDSIAAKLDPPESGDNFAGLSPDELEAAAPSTTFSAQRTASNPARMARQLRPAYQPVRVMYRKEFDLRVCFAAREQPHKNGTHSSRLLAEPTGSSGSASYYHQLAAERGADPHDIELEFRNIVSEANLVGEDDERRQTSAPALIDGGNRIVLLELALVVHDPLWSSGNVFVRAELDQVAPMQRSTHTIGDQTGVLRRCATAAALGDEGRETASGAACRNNKLGAAVAGWCAQCGLTPTAVTLYQAPLSDDQVVHYSEEMLSPLGTHAHTTRIDPRQQTLEVQSSSTLARDIAELHSADESAIAIGGSEADGTLFVSADVWRKHTETARTLVLNNLPLTDLSSARIRLAARGTAGCADRTIRVVVAAQCIEFGQL